MIIGYTTGVFDLFHVGHLKILKNSKSLCDRLIVGVTIDELVKYKNKRAVIPFEERMEIVRGIRYVDTVVPQSDMDKMDAWKRYKFNVMFVGDDWYENDQWKSLEENFSEVGVRVIYFPYSKGTSSTLVNSVLEKLRSNDCLI